MKAFIKKLSVLFAMGALVFGSGLLSNEAKLANAEEVEFNFSNVAATSGNLNEYWKFTTSQNGASSAPAYNSSSKEIRIYFGNGGNGGSLLISPTSNNSNYKITSISFTASSTSYTPALNAKYGDSESSLTGISSPAWTNTTYSYTNETGFSYFYLQNANTTNVQLRMKSVSITYSLFDNIGGGEVTPDPEPEEPETPTDLPYSKVTNIDDIKSGESYLISGNGNKFLPNDASIEKPKGEEISTSTDFSGYLWLFTSVNGKWNIKGKTNYINYKSSTGFKYESTASTSYTLASGAKEGTIRVAIDGQTRALIYRAGESNCFGAYSISNATATSSEYFDVELWKVSETSSGGEEGGDEQEKIYTSISIDLENSDLEYYENEKFLSSNICVLGHYIEDGTEKTEQITDFKVDLEDNTLLTVANHDNKIISVTYRELETATCTLSIIPDELDYLSLTGKTTSFTVGSEFTIGDSATLEAIYKSGNKVALTLEDVVVTLNNEVITLPYTLSIDDDEASIGISYKGVSISNYVIKVSESVVPTVQGKWILVNNGNELKVNDRIIITSTNNGYALSTNQKTDNRGAVGWDKISTPIYSDIQVLLLENGCSEGQFALNTGLGYLYAASASKNHLKTRKDLDVNGSWNITIIDGVASIVATDSENRNQMYYNPNNNSPLFSCYSSKNESYDTLSIYKFVSNYDSLVADLLATNTCANPGVDESTIESTEAINTFKETVVNLRERYEALSAEEKVKFETEYASENVTYLDRLIFLETKADSLKQASGLSSNLLTNLTSSNNTLIVLIVGLLGLTSILGYYFLNKKKYSC